MATYAGIWKKWILIPAWLAQFFLLGIWCVICGIALGFMVVLVNGNDTNDIVTNSERETLKDAATAIFAILGVFLGVGILEIVFNIVEIIQFARRKLSPVLVVVLSATSLLFWIAYLILGIFDVAHGRSGGIIWPILLIASYSLKLTYASVILHRVRKGQLVTRGTYAPAHIEAGYETYTTYERQTPNVANPFKETSREPSPAPPATQMYNLPVERPQGAAQEYYGPESIGQQSYEMGRARPHRSDR